MKIALAAVISASASPRAAEQDQEHQRGLEEIVVERREELAAEQRREFPRQQQRCHWRMIFPKTGPTFGIMPAVPDGGLQVGEQHAQVELAEFALDAAQPALQLDLHLERDAARRRAPRRRRKTAACRYICARRAPAAADAPAASPWPASWYLSRCWAVPKISLCTGASTACGNARAQAAIGLDRGGVGRDHEQDRRRDLRAGAPPRQSRSCRPARRRPRTIHGRDRPPW